MPCDIGEDTMIGAVILSFNDAKFAIKCVKSIQENSSGGEDIVDEIDLIIVDNGCDEKNTKILKSINIIPHKYIRLEKNMGVSIGYNTGIKQAFKDGCEYVVLFNADTEVKTKGWEQNMKKVFEKYKNTGMVGAMTNHINQKKQNIKFYNNELPNKVIKSKWVGLGLTMLSRKVVEDVGVLDENMGYGGAVDREYCLRLRLKGYQNYVDGNTFIFHHEGSNGFKNLGFKDFNLSYRKMRLNNHKYIKEKYKKYFIAKKKRKLELIEMRRNKNECKSI